MPNTYQHSRKGQAQKVRSSVNRVLANSLDERHEGTQIAKRYFTSGDSLRVYVAKYQTIGYLWRGRTKYEVGIWEPSTDGFGVTRAGERQLKSLETEDFCRGLSALNKNFLVVCSFSLSFWWSLENGRQEAARNSQARC